MSLRIYKLTNFMYVTNPTSHISFIKLFLFFFFFVKINIQKNTIYKIAKTMQVQETERSVINQQEKIGKKNIK